MDRHSFTIFSTQAQIFVLLSNFVLRLTCLLIKAAINLSSNCFCQIVIQNPLSDFAIMVNRVEYSLLVYYHFMQTRLQ